MRALSPRAGSAAAAAHHPQPGDITHQDDIDRIVAAAESKIDALANVAGVNDDFWLVHETSDAMWDRVIGINLTGAFKLSRAVLPIMLAAGRGSIVNVASEVGCEAMPPAPRTQCRSMPSSASPAARLSCTGRRESA